MLPLRINRGSKQRWCIQVQFQRRLEAETLGATAFKSALPDRVPCEEEASTRMEDASGQGQQKGFVQEGIAQWRPRLGTEERRVRQVERERAAVEDADIVKVLRRNRGLTLNQLVHMGPAATKSRSSLRMKE